MDYPIKQEKRNQGGDQEIGYHVKNQKMRTLDGYVVEINDDTLGITWAWKDYGGFYISREKGIVHQKKNHHAIMEQHSTLNR